MMREAHNCVTQWHGPHPLGGIQTKTLASVKAVKPVAAPKIVPVKAPARQVKTSAMTLAPGASQSMNLADLCQSITAETSIELAQVEKTMAAALLCMRRQLGGGGIVKLRDFGTFEPRLRAGIQARNPQTGEPVEIPPFNHVKYRAGKSVKFAINAGRSK